MKIKSVNTIFDMKMISSELKKENKRIGFVPTMGSLHQGHLSLIKESKKRSDISVVSIFVNPLQFGKGEDFEHYPRDIKGDTDKIDAAGADYLFFPSVDEIYPAGFKTSVEVSEITGRLCGRSRPGHFRGVATVVTKLLNIVHPDMLFLGQKDYQQCLVIKQFVNDLNMDTEIVILPTIREADGLAMSSRNQYLTPEERRSAAILFRALLSAKEEIEKGETNPVEIIAHMKTIINKEKQIQIDYISICDPDTLNEVEKLEGRTLISLAVRIGKTRLIDNMLINHHGHNENQR